jgi:hypothetical protein
MDQNGIDMSCDFYINVYNRKKELFYCTFKFSKILEESLMIKFLILLAKYYPDYYICSDTDEDKAKWKDFVINTNFKFEKNKGEFFYISPPVHVQKNSDTTSVYIKDGFTFSFSWDRKKECYNLLFDLYIDLFTNKIYLMKEGKYLEEDQSIAAAKNRKALSNCLEAIEKFFEGEIIEYITDYHLTPNSVYKYGIKEDASHKTDHIDF